MAVLLNTTLYPQKESTVNAGESNGRAKLTEAQVREIHRRASEGESRHTLAEEFGVYWLTIQNITSGKKWKHLGLPVISSRRGGVHPRSKLVEQDIHAIRLRLANGETCRQIARDYGVSGTTIANIRHGRTWKHVPVQQVNRRRAWES